MCDRAYKIIRKVFADFRAEGLFPIDSYRTVSVFANHSYRPLVAVKKNLNLRLFRVVFTEEESNVSNSNVPRFRTNSHILNKDRNNKCTHQKHNCGVAYSRCLSLSVLHVVFVCRKKQESVCVCVRAHVSSALSNLLTWHKNLEARETHHFFLPHLPSSTSNPTDSITETLICVSVREQWQAGGGGGVKIQMRKAKESRVLTNTFTNH